MDVTPTISSAEFRQQWGGFEVVVAFDPGKTTGCAIYDGDSIECRTLDFWGAAEMADELDPETTAVLIEDPGKVPPVFDRGVRGRRNLNIAQKVGKNKREASLLIDRYERDGFKTKAIRPRGKKWNAGLCKQLTGYNDAPNNQHTRDAIRLLYQEGVV